MDDRMKSPIATRVMSGIADKIASGVYPVGSVLPSSRRLAASLGVNKNTVAKAFNMLKEIGLVKTLPGEGMLVVKMPSVNRQDAQEMLVSSLDELLYQSRVMGISLDQVRRAFEDGLTRWYESVRVSIALVECNPYDASSLANHVRKEIPVSVQAILLPEFVAHAREIASEYDLIVTTFYHLAEVKASLGAEDTGKVVALRDKPTVKSLLKLAAIPEGTIGIVAGDERTLDGLERVLRETGRAPTHRAILEKPVEVQRLLDSCETVVVSARCLSELSRFAPGSRVVTVIFEVDTQSMDFLRTVVSRQVSYALGQ